MTKPAVLITGSATRLGAEIARGFANAGWHVAIHHLTSDDEAEALQERIRQYGERGSGKKALEDRHKRELRRHRTDELMAGLTAIAATYRDALVDDRSPRPNEVAAAVTRIHEAIESLERNPNESLLLQSLLWSLPALG